MIKWLSIWKYLVLTIFIWFDMISYILIWLDMIYNFIKVGYYRNFQFHLMANSSTWFKSHQEIVIIWWIKCEQKMPSSTSFRCSIRDTQAFEQVNSLSCSSSKREDESPPLYLNGHMKAESLWWLLFCVINFKRCSIN